MSKLAFLSVAALGVLGVDANNAVAQCCCGGTVIQPTGTVVENYVPAESQVINSEPIATQGQMYQRFSYSPAEVSPPVYRPTVSRFYSAQPQSLSYRRFSYQPRVQSRSKGMTHKQPWQYPKTDPRRYRSR